MELPLGIVLLGVAVVGIVMAIDFPMSDRTMWMHKYVPIRKKRLLDILQRLATHDSTAPTDQDHDQVVPPRNASAYERAKNIGKKEGTW